MSWLTIQEGYFYWLLCIVKSLLTVVEALTDRVLGYTFTRGWRSERELASADYKHSAQRVRILFRACYMPATSHDLTNFLWKHEEYMDPHFILENKHCTLMGVDKEHVWFCVTEQQVDVYNMEFTPFAFLSQYYLAKELIILPHWSLHRLAVDSVAKHQYDNCVIISNTGRCGSTALCRMLDRVPQTRVMSEPWGLLKLHTLYNRGTIRGMEFDKLLRSLMRLQLKREPGQDGRRIVIKLPLLCSSLMGKMQEAFPHAQQLFNTRHPRPSVASFLKLKLMAFEKYWMFMKFMSKDSWFDNVNLPYTEQYEALREKYSKSRYAFTTLEDQSIAFAGAVACYLTHKSVVKQTILYEDLVRDPRKEMETFFLTFGFPVEDLDDALKAMTKDSQNNMFKDNKAQASNKKASDILHEEEIDKIFQECQVPLSCSMTFEEFSQLFQS